MVEVLNLFKQDVIFEKRWASRTGFERIFIIADDGTGLSGKRRMCTTCKLM